MTHTILKRPQVERDIEECFVFIASENLDAGLDFLAAVEESVLRLAEFPLIGSNRSFTNKRFQNIRMWHVKDYEKYLIFYECFGDRVEIVRVLHAARDLHDLFG